MWSFLFICCLFVYVNMCVKISEWHFKLLQKKKCILIECVFYVGINCLYVENMFLWHNTLFTLYTSLRKLIKYVNGLCYVVIYVSIEKLNS